MPTATKPKPKIGLDPAAPVVKVRSGTPSVKGIDAKMSDLTLHSEMKAGMKLAVELNASVIAAELERTIEGASTVTLQVYDPELKVLRAAVLRARFTCRIAGLWFKLVSVKKSGHQLTLVFEDREVSWLRELEGPKKAYRDQVTRAEFFLMLLKEIKKGRIEFFCPEIHVKQSLAQDKDKPSKNSEDTEKQSNRESGLSSSDAGHIKIKGERPTPEALKNLNIVLDVGAELNMPYKVLWAAVAAGTVESLFKNYKAGEASDGTDSHGIFQMRPSVGFTTSDDVAVQAKQFYLGTGNGIKGAYEIYKSNPDTSVGELAADFENPAAQYRGRYAEWAAESKETLDTYLGGGGVGEGVRTTTSTQRFAFQVKKEQNFWEWMGEAADEVRWRRFMVAGKLYYCSEDYLFKSQVRMKITPTTRGIENVDFDLTMGKKVVEATVTCWAKDWSAPPGTVVRVEDFGPLDGDSKGKDKEKYAGRFLVVKINSNLFTDYCTVTIRKNMHPLPEPAPEKVTVKTSSFADASGVNGPQGASPSVSLSVEKMVNEIQRINDDRRPYETPGARGVPPPGSGNYDCSGFVSRILYVGGLLNESMATPSLAGWGKSGDGDLLTIFVRPPAGPSGHVIGKIWTPSGMRYFGTSGENAGGGAGWITDAGGDSQLSSLPVHRHAAGY